jgi:hypothetical protein
MTENKPRPHSPLSMFRNTMNSVGSATLLQFLGAAIVIGVLFHYKEGVTKANRGAHGALPAPVLTPASAPVISVADTLPKQDNTHALQPN